MFRRYIISPFRFSFTLFSKEEGSDNAGGGNSIDDIIKDVVDKNKPKEEVKPKEEKKPDEEDPTEEELAELNHAKELIKTLKNPESRKAFVAALIEKEGLGPDATKKEIAKVKRTIKDIVKEGLGDEYEILSERMEKVITQSLELYTEENVKPIKEDLSSKDLKVVQAAAETAYDKVFAEFANAKDLEKEVAKLCDEIKPGSMSPETYFRRLLKLAAEEKGVKLTPASSKDHVVKNFNEEKRKMNRNDASSRLASEGTDDGKVKSGPKDMTIDEAIAEGEKAALALLKK